MRSATSSGPASSDWESVSTTNSSPPSRATVSLSLMTADNRDATTVQQLVAGAMPEALIDLLEAIEVDQDRRHRRALPPRTSQQLLGAIHREGPVRQVGERVVEGLMAQLSGAGVRQVQRLLP